MSDHAEIIRQALEMGWSACVESAESVKHAEQIRVEWQGYVVALNGLLADHAAETERLNQRLEAYVSSADALAAVMYERDEARAENERLREQVLPGDMVCACLDETGGRTVTVWERCERCHAFMRMPDALAAAQERGEDPGEDITEPSDPEYVARVREIAADHGFPLSDWTPSKPAAQETPAEIAVEITDVGPVTGNLPTKRLLARLNLDGLADAQEPPAECPARSLDRRGLDWRRIPEYQWNR